MVDQMSSTWVYIDLLWQEFGNDLRFGIALGVLAELIAIGYMIWRFRRGQ